MQAKKMPTEQGVKKKLYCYGVPASVRVALDGMAGEQGWAVLDFSEFSEVELPDAGTALEQGRESLWVLISEGEELPSDAKRMQKIVLRPSGDGRAMPLSLRLPLQAQDFLFLLQTLSQPREFRGRGAMSGVHLSIVEKTVRKEGYASEVSLTDREVALLKFLMLNEMGADRANILQNVWGYHREVETQTLETHISRLRGKLGAIGLGLQVEAGCYRLL